MTPGSRSQPEQLEIRALTPAEALILVDAISLVLKTSQTHDREVLVRGLWDKILPLVEKDNWKI